MLDCNSQSTPSVLHVLPPKAQEVLPECPDAEPFKALSPAEQVQKSGGVVTLKNKKGKKATDESEDEEADAEPAPTAGRGRGGRGGRVGRGGRGGRGATTKGRGRGRGSKKNEEPEEACSEASLVATEPEESEAESAEVEDVEPKKEHKIVWMPGRPKQKQRPKQRPQQKPKQRPRPPQRRRRPQQPQDQQPSRRQQQPKDQQPRRRARKLRHRASVGKQSRKHSNQGNQWPITRRWQRLKLRAKPLMFARKKRKLRLVL